MNREPTETPAEKDPLAPRRRKLTFRSWHRGTREMDLLMGTFAETHLAGLDEAGLDEYEDILNEPDPDLYNWIVGASRPPANKFGPVFRLLLRHRFAT